MNTRDHASADAPAEVATDMEVLEWGRPEQAYKVGEGWRRVHRIARAGVREADQRCLRARCDAAAVHFHVNNHRLAIEEQGKIDLDVGQQRVEEWPAWYKQTGGGKQEGDGYRGYHGGAHVVDEPTCCLF